MKIEILDLEKNNLTGPVPEAICEKHDSIAGSLLRLYVDCVVECQCCDNCGFEMNLNQKETYDRLKLLSGEKISDPDTPQYKAAYWMLWENKLQYPAKSRFLYQRYVLVLMYFMMGDETWFEPLVDIDECHWEKVGCNSDYFVENIKFGALCMISDHSTFFMFTC